MATTTKNRLNLDFADLPDLKAALGGLAPGDRCSVTFEIMVVDNNEKGLEGDIESVEYQTPDGESEAGSESVEVETSADEPILAVISKRNAAKKKPAPKADAKPDADTEEDV